MSMKGMSKEERERAEQRKKDKFKGKRVLTFSEEDTYEEEREKNVQKKKEKAKEKGSYYLVTMNLLRKRKIIAYHIDLIKLPS